MTNCNDVWQANSQLYTDPLRPKGLSADPCAAYGLMAFVGDNPRLKLVLTGEFIKSKFISLQIYRGRLQRHDKIGKALIDYEIEPETGKNPFREKDPNVTGTFKIEITPDKNGPKNSIWYEPVKLGTNRKIISAFYRIYQPERQLTLNDLPKIEARDCITDTRIECPEYAHMAWYLDLPELVANVVVQERNKITFKKKESSAGTNIAIPAYLYSASKISHGDVVVIKFQAPAIDYAAPFSGHVRYWSICTMDWPKLQTLNGLACDWNRPQSRPVTLVFGGGERVRNKAKELGFDFLPDTREPNQHVLGFIYRNMLPSDTFKSHMYKNEFMPKAKIYSENEFLNTF